VVCICFEVDGVALSPIFKASRSPTAPSTRLLIACHSFFFLTFFTNYHLHPTLELTTNKCDSLQYLALQCFLWELLSLCRLSTVFPVIIAIGMLPGVHQATSSFSDGNLPVLDLLTMLSDCQSRSLRIPSLFCIDQSHRGACGVTNVPSDFVSPNNITRILQR